MGRLTKKKIDDIAKLRGEGYTQSEVSQRLDVCLKTVRKYDPGSVAGSAKEWRDLQGLPERVKNLEEIVKTLTALAWSYKLEKDVAFWICCNNCGSAAEMEILTDEKTGKQYYGCSECGAEVKCADLFWGPLPDIFN